MKRVLLALLAVGVAAAQSDADLTKGKKLFAGHCAPCHGIDGTGGRGANLAVPKLKRASTDDDIAELIKSGIPGTIMDGAWQLSDREVEAVVAYVRSLGRAAVVALPGEAERGRKVYRKSGCAGCHVIQGEGTGFGPELTVIGAQRSAAYLREAILDPAATIPQDFLMVRVQPRDGLEVTGLRVNEDSFSIQIKDSNNQYHSFRKTELASLDKETKQSAMPSYAKTLSSAEVDDLVAYLASLRGEQ
ncbi:MAG: c-type cytochrome [Acidobacteriaceae bacterium]|nr:c-type cytochrome [Acidobacteriaceae bacterium]